MYCTEYYVHRFALDTSTKFFFTVNKFPNFLKKQLLVKVAGSCPPKSNPAVIEILKKTKCQD